MTPGTIYALASGRPPAAIAIVRVSGPAAHRAGELLAGGLPEPRTAAVRQLRHPDTRELLDETLIVRFDAPASATGEDVVELHCHGGRAVVDAVLAALADLPGCREATPGEFTRRALANGRVDLTEAEGLADLLEAETQSQRRAALTLAGGGLRKQIGEWQERALSLSALAELAIDYVDDDEVAAPATAIAADCSSLAAELREWCARPQSEPLREGVKVVIAGPPNAGKSSLLNRIAGFERAIVAPTAGTTRDHIEVPLAIQGVPIVLTDTAGLRNTADSVEAVGVARAVELQNSADILIWMGTWEAAPAHERIVVVHPKSDLGHGTLGDDVLPVSAFTGEGVAEILDRVVTLARALLPEEGRVALNRRQAATLGAAAEALTSASQEDDVVLVAEHLRTARLQFNRLSGAAGVEDVLDALFARFCLGK